MLMEEEKPVSEETEDVATDNDFGNKVILYNDEVHTFEQVTTQVMAAIGCSEQEAFKIAYMVDRAGLAIVYQGEIGECLRVSGVLQEIQLKTEITT